MQFNINLIAAAILFAPSALAIGPGKCFFGGAFGAGSCHSLDFNGNPTDTFSDCPTSSPCTNNLNDCNQDALNGVTTCS
ncbi:hypothetical protein TsFJ059_003112 [Trichoderma semiorbis]|uniref:Uncharacterized protein n=1 Tax=Trichoderma semiorbis TaxID=1491008 RepID=A0A9P8HKU5_9HYPO|nr:hypothetical protein TsFJ059_003112 [Trichoderma semiorbis]